MSGVTDRSLRLHAALALAMLAVVAASGCQQIKRYVSAWNLPGSTANLQAYTANPDPAPRPTKEDGVQFRFAMARSLEGSGELEQAASAYEEVIRSDKKHAAARHRLAVVCDKLGKSDLADQHFRAALKHSPDDAELLSDYGYSLYARGQFAEAEAHLLRALQQSPHLTRAHNNLGLILARTNRAQASIASFRAAGCNPGEAYANAAFALMLEERWAEAEQQLANGLAVDPQAAVVRKRVEELQAIRAHYAAQTLAAQPVQLAPANFQEPIAAGPGHQRR